MDIKIRQETKDDFTEVFELVRRAFGQNDEAKLVDALRNNPTAFVPELSLVATNDNNIVGHILFTKIKITVDNVTEFDSLALAPMAVKPDIQKKGIGGQLIRAGLDIARKLNFKSVMVLGHKHYYPKFGFEPASKWRIQSPFDVPTEVFMGIELIEGGLENVSGTVNYPKEFDKFK